MLDDGSIVFDIPDHIWEQLNKAKKWKFLCQASLYPVIPANRRPVPFQQQHPLLVLSILSLSLSLTPSLLPPPPPLSLSLSVFILSLSLSLSFSLSLSPHPPPPPPPPLSLSLSLYSTLPSYSCFPTFCDPFQGGASLYPVIPANRRPVFQQHLLHSLLLQATRRTQKTQSMYLLTMIPWRTLTHRLPRLRSALMVENDGMAPSAHPPPPPSPSHLMNGHAGWSKQGVIRDLFTISSPTRTLKWPGCNPVQITCNTSTVYHVQVSCYVPLGTKGLLSY